MLRTAQAPAGYGRPSSPGWLLHHSRSIQVRVLDGGREVDSFQASSPRVLSSAIRPIEAHLPVAGATIQFLAIEKAWLPLGMARVSTETELDGLGAALSFLAA